MMVMMRIKILASFELGLHQSNASKVISLRKGLGDLS